MRIINRCILLLTPVLFLCFGAVSAFALTMVSVAAENVNLRSGPGTNYDVKWQYGSGFPLIVKDSKGDWLQVEDFEKDTGWLHKDYTSREGHMIVKGNKDKKSRINIRSGPGTSHKVVGKAYYGVVFKTLNQQDGWVKVRHEKGLEGWIKRSLMWGF
jgi:SH3-like domain-containing protein